MLTKYFILIYLSIFSLSLFAATKITLKDALLRAKELNGDLKAQSYKIVAARTDIDRAYGEFGPKIDSIVGVAPMQKVTGDALHATKERSNFGAMFLGELSLMWPLYTWDRKSDLVKAANGGVEVERADYEMKENEILYDLKRFYYGSQYAKALKEFISEAKGYIEQAIEHGQKRGQESEVAKLTLLKGQVDLKASDIDKEYLTALSAIKLYLNLKEGDELQLQDESLTLIDRTLLPLDDYLKLAMSSHPDLKKLSNGIAAKKILATAEDKSLLPVVGVLAKYEFSESQKSTTQTSPFANDPYNKDDFSIGVGLKWSFDFGATHAKSQKIRAEVSELTAKQQYADLGIALLVKKAYLNVVSADEKVAIAKSGYKFCKKWLLKLKSGETLGLNAKPLRDREVEEMIPLVAQAIKDYYEAVYNQHMAWAALSLEVGKHIDHSFD